MAASFGFTPFIAQTATGFSVSKAYPANVNAGDLLFCFTWRYHATDTCTGVSDDINGAWTQAFGPVRGNGSNSNATLYGFYRKNSAAGGSPTAGTVTATWSASAGAGIVIGRVAGLAGGGDLDKVVSSLVAGFQSDVSFGTTGTLAQAVEAVAMMVIAGTANGLASPHSGLTADATIDSFYYERTYRGITSTNASIDAGFSYSGTVNITGGLMTFKDAQVADLSGSATLADMTASGTLATQQADLSGSITLADLDASGALSSGGAVLSGSATLADMTASGTIAPQPGVITSEALYDNTGALLANTALDFYAVYDDSTGALVVRKTGLSTNGSGVVQFSDAAVIAGVTYRHDWQTSTGKRGMPRKAAA